MQVVGAEGEGGVWGQGHLERSFRQRGLRRRGLWICEEGGVFASVSRGGSGSRQNGADGHGSSNVENDASGV